MSANGILKSQQKTTGLEMFLSIRLKAACISDRFWQMKSQILSTAYRLLNIIRIDSNLRKIKGKGKYSVLRFSRLNNYIGEAFPPTEPIDESGVEAKRKLYDSNRVRALISFNHSTVSKVSN